MAPKGNNVIPNAHFHKHWQKYIKTWFNQPARKLRRSNNRIKKAKAIAPRPAAGRLRPIVHCPTVRYNNKVRLGRGFTLEEIKAAGLNAKFARTVGISVDHRRRNKTVESLQTNVQRLKEYKSRLILFPRHPNAKRKSGDSATAGEGKKLKQGEATEEERKVASQLKGPLMPIMREKPRFEVRAVTDKEKASQAYSLMRQRRIEKKLAGIREKKAKEAAENPEYAKKLAAEKEKKKNKKKK